MTEPVKKCVMAPDPKFDKALIEAQAESEAEEAAAVEAAVEHLKIADAPDLTAEQLLAADELAVVKIYVPEWGGNVYLRQIAGYERDSFEASCQERKGQPKLGNFRARFAALVLCDADGKRMFTPAQAVFLGKKNAKALDRIFDEGSRLNGIGERDVEELEKNSGSARSGEPGSDSPLPSEPV